MSAVFRVLISEIKTKIKLHMEIYLVNRGILKIVSSNEQIHKNLILFSPKCLHQP